MRLYALNDLRLRCKQRCDKETDAHISDPEWNRLISEMYGEIFSVVEGAGMRHFESAQTINTTNNTQVAWALPSDHLATIDVEFVWDTVNNRRRRLRKINVQERTRWMGLQGDARRYELAGQFLTLYPTPSSGTTYVHTYMPQAPDYSLAPDNTMVDLVHADGEAFLMWGVAVKALAKSEGSTDLAMTERDAARERFATWCAMRSFNDSPRPFVDTGDGAEEWGDPWNPASFLWNPPH